MRIPALLALALAASTAAETAQVDDAAAVALAKPKELIVAGDIGPAAKARLLEPVDAFYGF